MSSTLSSKKRKPATLRCQRDSCQSSRLMNVTAKCSDTCTVVSEEYSSSGYVPQCIPAIYGNGWGDFVDLSFCMECGQLQGDFPLQTDLMEKQMIRDKFKTESDIYREELWEKGLSHDIFKKKMAIYEEKATKKLKEALEKYDEQKSQKSTTNVAEVQASPARKKT